MTRAPIGRALQGIRRAISIAAAVSGLPLSPGSAPAEGERPIEQSFAIDAADKERELKLVRHRVRVATAAMMSEILRHHVAIAGGDQTARATAIRAIKANYNAYRDSLGQASATVP